MRKRLVGAPHHIRAANTAANLHGKAQVIPHIAPWKQQVALRHVTTVTAPPVDLFATDENLARFFGQQLIRQAENGRLAAAGRADDRHELAFFDVERQPVDDIEILGVILEYDVLKLEHRLTSPRPTPYPRTSPRSGSTR